MGTCGGDPSAVAAAVQREDGNSNIINQQHQCHVSASPSTMKLCLSLTWSVMAINGMSPLLLAQRFGSRKHQQFDHALRISIHTAY
jgi:hypothetical protein